MKQIMNKRLLYIAWLFPLLLACSKEQPAPAPSSADDQALVFEVADLMVKAGESDASFNENRIQTLDVYFYPAGGTDGDAVFHKRMTPNAIGLYSTRIDFTYAEISLLFASGPSCEVYAIANIDSSLLPASLSGTDIPSLKGIALAQNWFGSQSGASHKQDSFVMDGQQTLYLISTTATEVAVGKVLLYRIATKLSLMVNVESSIRVPVKYKDEEDNIYDAEEEWVPMTDMSSSGTAQVQAYLVNGYSQAKLGVRTAPETYLPNTATADRASYYDYRSNRMPYHSGKTETVQEDERYTWLQHLEDPDNVTTDMVGTPTGNRTDVTYMVSDPSYSYPQTWTQGAETEPYFKLELPWRRTSTLYVYKNGKDQAPEVLTNGRTGQKQYYYKIVFPNKSMLSNNWYQYKIHVGILGSDTDDAKVELTCTYMVAHWQNKSEVIEEAEVGNARYLSVAQEAYTLYNETTLDIPYISSDNCVIVNATYTKPYYGTNTNGKSYDAEHGYYYTSGSAASWLSLSDGKIRFNHAIINQVSTAMDVAPYTVTFTIRHSDDASYSREVTIFQYPAIYMEKKDGGSAFIDGYFAHVKEASMSGARRIGTYYGRSDGNAGVQTTRNNTYDLAYDNYYTSASYDGTVTTTYNGQVTTPYDVLLRSQVPGYFTLLYLTRITITAFTSTDNKFRDHTSQNVEYIIGDPRVESGWNSSNLENYLVSQPANGTNRLTLTTRQWTNASSILIGGDNTAIIAPSILISSGWNAVPSGNAFTFDMAKKRCATYQEGGYPAGRWRLPTEAEVYFVQSLQQNEQIPVLFNMGSDYWTSSGYLYNGTSYTPATTGSHDTGIRCVYDVWYWGDKPESISTYHPAP